MSEQDNYCALYCPSNSKWHNLRIANLRHHYIHEAVRSRRETYKIASYLEISGCFYYWSRKRMHGEIFGSINEAERDVGMSITRRMYFDGNLNERLAVWCVNPSERRSLSFDSFYWATATLCYPNGLIKFDGPWTDTERTIPSAFPINFSVKPQFT